MGKNRVKGIVVEIGGETRELDKALEGVNKRAADTQGQLKDVERLLKLDPTNTVLLEQKQRLLAQAAQESREKLETLNRAQEQAGKGMENYAAWEAAFGPVQAEIDKTKKALGELRAAQRAAERSGEAYTGEYRKLEADIRQAEEALQALVKRRRELEAAGQEDTEDYRALQQEIGRTEEALKALKKQRQSALKSGTAYTADFEKLRQESQAAREKLAQLEKQAEEINREFGHPISGEKFEALQREIAETESNLEGLEGQLKDFGSVGIQQAVAVGDKFQDAGKKIADVGDKIFDAGKKLSVVSGAAAAGVTAAVKWADDLDSSVDRYLATTGTEDTAAPAVRESVERIYGKGYGKGYGESYGDVAQALSEVRVRMPELDDDQLREATESALALRDVFGKDVPESLRGVDSLMSQFGISSQEAFNLIVQGAQKGLDQNGDLLDVVNEYAVHFKRAGYSANDMFNMLLSGADAGVFSVDKLADAVKEFTIRASNGTAADAILENARALNLTQAAAKELAEQVKTGSPEAFRVLLEQLKTVEDETERYQLGVELFGTMFEDLGEEAVLALFDMRQEIDMAAESMDAVKEKNFDNVSDNAANLGRSFVEKVAVPIGEELLPVLDDAIGKIGEFLDRFGEMDENTRKLIVNAGLIIAALGPAMLLTGGIVTGVGKIISWIGMIPGALAGVAAFLAAHPLVLPLAGIFAAMAAIGILSDQVQSFLDNTLGAMSNQWGGIFDGLYVACSLVTQFLGGVFSGDWDAAWAKLEESCGAALGRLTEVFIGWGEKIYEFFTGLWDFFGSLGGSGYIPGVSDAGDWRFPAPSSASAGTEAAVLTGQDGQEVLTRTPGGAVVQQNVDNSDHSTVTHGDIHVSIYAAPGQSPEEIGREAARQIQWEYESEDAGL